MTCSFQEKKRHLKNLEENWKYKYCHDITLQHIQKSLRNQFQNQVLKILCISIVIDKWIYSRCVTLLLVWVRVGPHWSSAGNCLERIRRCCFVGGNMSLRMGLEFSKDSDYLELCPSVSCCVSKCVLWAAALATRHFPPVVLVRVFDHSNNTVTNRTLLITNLQCFMPGLFPSVIFPVTFWGESMYFINHMYLHILF